MSSVSFGGYTKFPTDSVGKEGQQKLSNSTNHCTIKDNNNRVSNVHHDHNYYLNSSASNNGSNSSSKKRRTRTRFEKWQLKELETAFEANHYPNIFVRKTLATRLYIDKSKVDLWFQNRRAKWRKEGNAKIRPGRPSNNTCLPSCSGYPISPDEIIKQDNNKKEETLRKQLENQVKELQQLGLKPGDNSSSLTEAIHQTLKELGAMNCGKEAKDLVGSETYSLLVDTLNIDVVDILKKVIPMTQNANNKLTTTSQNKSAAFLIENLLSSCGNKKTSSDGKLIANNNNVIIQPIGFIVNNSSRSLDYHDDDLNFSNDSSVESDLMLPNLEWTSSSEIDVTGDSDEYANVNDKLKDDLDCMKEGSNNVT